MTKALVLSKRQTQVLLRAAEAEKGVVEVKLDGIVIRLIPNCRVQEFVPVDEIRTPASFENLDDYRSWRNRTRANRA